jgi:hypothetical protein
MDGCGNCKFYEHRPNTQQGGNCRRHPPQIIDALVDSSHAHDDDGAEPVIAWASRFPIVDVSDWCGEWRVGPSEN